MSQGATRIDRYEELYDRDVESLIAGGTPDNTDLIPLIGIVAELRSMARVTVSEDLIEFHAAEAAEFQAAQRGKASRSVTPSPGRRMVDGLRRKVTASAASLLIVVSASGVALASDGAVPGDWNYGLDRALEGLGIGAGGGTERDHELLILDSLDAESAHSDESLARVTDLLTYLGNADRVDGAAVSEIASNGAARPENPGASGSPGKPEDPGASGSAGKPEDPGASGSAGKPEDPGASGNQDNSEVPERGRGVGHQSP